MYDQAAELGGLLDIPVIYASPPSTSLYVMGPSEVCATYAVETVSTRVGGSYSHTADLMIEDDDDAEEGDEEDEFAITDEPVAVADSEKEKIVLCTLSDYTDMASHVWIDGIRDPSSGRYITGHTPFLFLTKKALNRSPKDKEKDKQEDSIAMGGRPIGILERMLEEGVITLKSGQKAGIEGISKILNSTPAIVPVVPTPELVKAISEHPLDSARDGYSSSSTAVVEDDENSDDDDFFGAPATVVNRVRPQKAFIPAAAPAVPTAIPDIPSPVVVREVVLDEVIAPPTAGEIEDNRKSKKQRVVSVQARLAERQRLLSEAQQRRQSVITTASNSKAEQTKEYQQRKTVANGAVSDSISAGERREGYSIRTARTSVPGEVIHIVTGEEFKEPVVEDDDDSDGLWV